MAKNVMRAFKMSEISAVDRPAQAHARAAIMKRDVVEYWKRDFTSDQRDAAARSGAALPDGSFPIENSSDLHNAMRAIGRAKDPEKAKEHIRARAKSLGLESQLSAAFKRDESGIVELIKRATTYLAESVSSILTSKSADKATLLEKTFDQFSDHLGGELNSEVAKALAAGGAATSDKELAMNSLKKALGLPDSATDAEVTAAVTKALADAKAAGEAIAKMTTDLAIAKAAMDDTEKAHHDGLKDDGEKEKFRSMSSSERKAKMAKRDELPAHIRKQLEEADDLKKRLAALEDKDEVTALSKRALEIGLPEADGVTIQKAYRGDKTAVDKLLDVVKALTAQVKAAGLFKEIGDGRDNGGKNNSAYDELMTKAEELKKKETGLSIDQAFAKVYADPANAELAKRERGENRPRAA